MTVSAKLISSLTALQTQVTAAAPLQSAPYAKLKAIQLNAEQLEVDTTTALYAAAGQLDSWVPPGDQFGIVAGFQAIVESALDEWRILDMLFVISRANLNVDLLLGVSPPLPGQDLHIA